MKFDKYNIVAGDYIGGDPSGIAMTLAMAECWTDESLKGYVNEDYVKGFTCACSFLSIPKESGLHGMPLKEFILNAKRNQELLDQLHGLMAHIFGDAKSSDSEQGQ